ncbi:MAG: 3-phosphoshikimate 1-carboxyvinyltransferase [Chthoniobacterales bacterium]|nr:3-phosphoshikimate 1-carboxyvinyltransferase [Chthoniobacterales bacterium]
MEIKVRQSPAWSATMEVPGDKSMSHRAAMLASLTDGPCLISNYLAGEDCLGTLRVLRQLGVAIEDRGAGSWRVHGVSGKFRRPEGDLDCGNSGTTMRLISGLLAAQPFRSRLTGDASLSKRPMRRIMEPLGQMGAKLSTEGSEGRPPLVIEGSPQLRGIEYRLPVPSAQVKSAVLLAGLLATGTTSVIQAVPTRDHTERMLSHFGVPVEENGERIFVVGGKLPEARDFDVPGDISSAAFWLVAAAAKPGSRLVVENLGLNPTRTGVIKVLERMGARILVREKHSGSGEPCGTLEVEGGALHGTMIEGAEIPNVIDEIPVLAVAAALAKGTTVIKDAAELRVKESDRLAVTAHHLRAMGADLVENPDGLVIRGGRPLHGARLESHGDHRIAMAFAVAGLFAAGETVISGTECVETSYPGFAAQLGEITNA